MCQKSGSQIKSRLTRGSQTRAVAVLGVTTSRGGGGAVVARLAFAAGRVVPDPVAFQPALYTPMRWPYAATVLSAKPS